MRTLDAIVTFVVRTVVPATFTDNTPMLTVTITCCGVLRSVGMLLVLVCQERDRAPGVGGPFVMPMKLDDGLPPPLKVSSATASPGIPEKPSPPPAPPIDVAVAPLDGSANVSVSPSAPLPLSMYSSNATVSDCDETAPGQNA